MYIPKHFKGEHLDEAIAFMQRFNFGTLISSIDGLPVATHLPFVITQHEDDIRISSHLAKANVQGKHLASSSKLIVFSEPHAYISPKHYEKEQNVPTWNYMSVHVYGKARIIKEYSKVVSLLEAMINSYEPEYKLQWNGLSEDYKKKMANGIVAFEIKVDQLQFKKKLSQNKKADERESIISTLSESVYDNEKLIAEYMKEKGLG